MKECYATVPEMEGGGFEHQLMVSCYKKLIGAGVAGRKQIHFRSFRKTLHFLLTNVVLVKEEYLSLLHADDPTLPVCHLDLRGNIDIDELGQTTLAPLNMTLGILNTLTRNSRPAAWDTIYFHPTGSHDKGDKLIDNENNLHSGLRVALESLKEACNLTEEEIHDQCCGHYQTANTQMICRHCNYQMTLGNNARVNVLKAPVSMKTEKMKVSKD
eukprot:jgi/Psemu1/26519/gm1.26519_g